MKPLLLSCGKEVASAFATPTSSRVKSFALGWRALGAPWVENGWIV